MREQLTGQGKLETLEPPEKIYPVAYDFDISAEILVKQQLPRVAWTVRVLNGRTIPDGSYRLHAADGEILEVRNIDNGSYIVR